MGYALDELSGASPAPMTLGFMRFSPQKRWGRRAYGIQTSLQIGSFAEAVYAPVYAVPDHSRTLVEAAGYGAHSYSASGSRSSLSRPSVRRASAKACRS